MKEPVLQTSGLTKRFGSVTGVEDLNLEVRQGEVYGFIGPNGSGKTTTISMCLGLLHPTAGGVRILGQEVSPADTRALRRVGSLLGATGMVPSLSGRSNLRLLARLYADVDDRRVDEVLDFVGLTQAARRKVKGYSLGMGQRLGLAAALLHRPELLILDEPTNGLDPAGMREIRELVRKLADDGVTVFLSSHLLHEVEQVCDRVTVLSQGREVARGRVSDLRGETQLVRIRIQAVDEASAALTTLPGAAIVRTDGDYLEIKGAPSEAVIIHLVERGLVPSEVTNGHADLESVFLDLTGRKNGRQGAEPSPAHAA
jgi:ABC-2 type transport system ATP-binding protein